MTKGKILKCGNSAGRLFLLPRVNTSKKVKEAVKPVVAPLEPKPIQISEKEERLADLLEAAQDMKPLADGSTDGVAEERPMPLPESLPEEVVDLAAVIPEEKKEEWVEPEQPRKKRRGRRGKKNKAAMVAAEQVLL